MASLADCLKVFKKTIKADELDLFFQKAGLYQEAPKNLPVGESYKLAAADIIDELEIQKDSVLKQVAPKAEKPTEKSYFTMSRAERLISKNYSDTSDSQLQKDFVILRDYIRFINDHATDEHAFNSLIEGGYFASAATAASTGVTPVDAWMKNNLDHALERASKERSARIEAEKPPTEATPKKPTVIGRVFLERGGWRDIQSIREIKGRGKKKGQVKTEVTLLDGKKKKVKPESVRLSEKEEAPKAEGKEPTAEDKLFILKTILGSDRSDSMGNALFCGK